jgi:hypothetical protein
VNGVFMALESLSNHMRLVYILLEANCARLIISNLVGYLELQEFNFQNDH